MSAWSVWASVSWHLETCGSQHVFKVVPRNVLHLQLQDCMFGASHISVHKLNFGIALPFSSTYPVTSPSRYSAVRF